MDYASARRRYLAALGLSTASLALGCQRSEPGAAPIAAPQTASTGAASHHTEAWIPAADPAPEVPRPGAAQCPHGPFCVPQPDATCAPTVALPHGIGPDTIPNGRQPSVTFDADRTAAERASDPGACCYQWRVLCVGGRALRGPGGPLTAKATARADWLDRDTAALAARLGAADLAPPARAALAAHWEREAAFEHASVASFARASLALLSVGAPPDLVAATHAAAIDEVEHARLGYALASAYAGAPRGPSALPLAGAIGEASLITVAVETFVDACAGESAAALMLREAAATAQDPAMRALLERIAADEERHAELAWRTVAWALSTGGASVARALANVMNDLRAELEIPGASNSNDCGPDLGAHGVLDAATRRAVRRRALTDVILPCASALLRRATFGVTEVRS